MKPLLADRIKNVLSVNRSYGATAQEIADAMGIEVNTTRVMLNTMRDAYIYKWIASPTGRNFVAVWKGVPVPANAERPPGKSIKRSEYDNRYKERKKAGLVVKRAPRVPKTVEPVKVEEPVKPAPQKTVWQSVKPWSEA